LQSEAELAKGKFLVAGRHLGDPNFSESVVLLVDYNQDGAMGLVINQPTEVRLSTVLPEIEAVQQRTDTVYIGGPVARGQMLLLIRSGSQPEESRPVFANTYISSSRAVLERMINHAQAGEKFRVYAGYAGWAPGQLDQEVSRGDWRVLPADAEIVFDRAAAEIWPELIRRGSLEWTRVPRTHLSSAKGFYCDPTLLLRTPVSLD
jgi:putative transcriptional regulator